MSSHVAATRLHHGPANGKRARLHENPLVSMRSTVPAKGRQARSHKSASLSVVVLSMGTPGDTHRASQKLGLASRDLGAQLIVVSHRADPALARSVESTGAEFVAAPPGSSRAEMCDLGMRYAMGSIVVMRDDAAVNDARWLDAYRAVLPRREVSARAPVESIVMDTMVTGRSALADAGAAFPSLDPIPGGNGASVELASTS